MNMMGELTFFLRFHIKQSKLDTFVHQTKYTKDLLRHFDMGTVKPISTPMGSTAILDPNEDGESVDQKEYRSIIGSLLYLTALRPDIHFIVCLCAHLQTSPRVLHHQANPTSSKSLSNHSKRDQPVHRKSTLDVDVKNEGPSKAACTDIIKKGVRQKRYHLKRKYFDESLTREQMMAKEPPPKMKKEEWIKLVDYWCDPKNQRPKYNNMDPDPVDFFGECMTSPQNGRTPLADDIYEQMVAEKEREPEEGQEQKSPTKIVADSLSQISRSSTFLPNIGVPRASNTARSTTVAEARLQAQFEATLQAEREEAARNQQELQAQIQAQQASLEENKNLLRQTQEDMKGMHNKFEETNALLRAVLKLQRD